MDFNEKNYSIQRQLYAVVLNYVVAFKKRDIFLFL